GQGWRRIALLLCKTLLGVERIFGILHRIVGANGNRAHAKGLQLVNVADDTVDHRLDVRAVVADEHDERAIWPAQLFEAIGLAVSAGQRERRRLPAEIANRGLLSHQDILSASSLTAECRDKAVLEKAAD